MKVFAVYFYSGKFVHTQQYLLYSSMQFRFQQPSNSRCVTGKHKIM